MTHRLIPRRTTLLSAVLAVVGVLGLTSCSETAADSIDYVVDGKLTTYNTNTVVGAASGGPAAFARVLTGFNYHGPDGQVVGDHDFGSISVVGRTPLILDYEIKAEAVYSDGKPITCDDMVLAWASQSGRFPWFDAANRAGYTDIASIAMRAMLLEPQVTAIIVGVRHDGHLGRHARVFDIALDDDDLARIEAELDRHDVVDGDVYDVERDRHGRHGRIMKYNLNEA